MAKVKFENRKKFKKSKGKAKKVLRYSKPKNNTSIVSVKKSKKRNK